MSFSTIWSCTVCSADVLVDDSIHAFFKLKMQVTFSVRKTWPSLSINECLHIISFMNNIFRCEF